MTPPTFRFGPFHLDPGRRLIERDGQPLPLGPRSFDILQVLIEQRDRVLTRAEIMAHVWPGLAVEEHNLSVQMSKLRRALGDGGAEGQVIATIPGRGYRFVARLEGAGEPPAPAGALPGPAPAGALSGPAPAGALSGPAPAGALPGATPPPRRRQAAIAACAALLLFIAWAALRAPGVPAPPLSLVVMPLRDLSDTPGHAYLADAISDDLTTDLAQIPGSTVIARETADSFKGRAVPAGEIGRTLHVRYLLEGSLRAEAAALHINAQLIDARTGGHVWAQRFDVARADLGSARDTIVHRIAAALDVELVAAETAQSRHDRPDDPTALDLFFQARSIQDHDDSLAGFKAAQGLLEQALAKQPDFADALAGLGALLLRKTQSVDDPTDQADYAEAQAMIARALAASPRNSIALAARAQALLIEDRYTDAAYAARAALAGDAGNLDALGVLAKAAFAQARLTDAVAPLETLLRINPGSLAERSHLLLLGNVRLLQGQTDAAIDLLQRAIAGDPQPASGVDGWGRAEGARLLLIAAAAIKGDAAGAAAAYQAYDRLWPHRSVWRIAATASRPLAALPGFARMLAALRSAGMPDCASEAADDHVAPTSTPIDDANFAATPLAAPGARTIGTAALARMLQDHADLLLIDLGPGAAVPSGALWEDDAARTGDDMAFIDAAIARRHAGPDVPIVVMSDGPYGAASYNAVLHLVSAGRTVLWYRGGEEAWAGAHLQAADRRA